MVDIDPLLFSRSMDESAVAQVNSHMSGTGHLTSLEENQISDLHCFASDFVTENRDKPTPIIRTADTVAYCLVVLIHKTASSSPSTSIGTA